MSNSSSAGSAGKIKDATRVPDDDVGTYGAAGSGPQRQSRPIKVADNYPVRKMTYLQITTQELRTLGLSSGAGSVGLAFAGYFAKEAYAQQWAAPLVLATIGFVAVSICVYIIFFGLVISIRRTSNLKGLGIFGE
jgi:hypothetical protein